jgi:kumamolisin
MAEPQRRNVQGSERAPVEGGRVVGRVADEETIDVTVRLRVTSAVLASRTPAAAPMTRVELEQQHRASPEDVRAVEAFAQAQGLTVVDSRPQEHAVHLRGPARAMQDAFGVVLERVEHPHGGTFRRRTGPVQVPAHLAEIVTGVFGLDNRPQARPHVRVAAQPADATATTGAATDGTATDGTPTTGTATMVTKFPGTFFPPQIAQVYDFPTGVDGKGQTIALIELGGGYLQADLDTYATQLGLPAFQVTAISVDGGQNVHGVNGEDDNEVTMDIEIAAAVAPRAAIAVYFAPNTARGLIDALSAAVHDTQRNPGVISVSWGHAENSWTPQARKAIDQVLQEADAIGVPVFASAGDDGVLDKEATGKHVEYPASSPHAISCGGTRLAAAQNLRTTETVWNDLAQNRGATGGGFSAFYKVPEFQKPWLGTQQMRGVPDLAANGDSETGYQIWMDGMVMVAGGTSAVAPLLAGLTALCNQQAGHGPGVLLPKLYAGASPSSSFFDVVEGNNGGFSAAPGWDPCSGLGVPIGTAFATLGWGSAAREPGTPA